MDFSHIPVLFNETIDSLDIKPDGIYCDCTAGGGGHSKAIADRLSEKGRLVAVDQDPDAIENLRQKFASYNNVIIIKDNFKNIDLIARSLGIDAFDGILADLGVSSHQLDTPERGFSFHYDAPLDMRMSQEGLSAYDVVNTFSEKELTKIMYTYGEEKYAPRIARLIVERREKEEYKTTFQLVDTIRDALPAKVRRENGHPGRKVFQSFRIFINGEIEILPDSIEKMFSLLKKDGRLSIITFHSLEDRTVKNMFRSFIGGCTCPKDFPVCVCGKTPDAKFIHKSLGPSREELEKNPRSRSARLRCIQKLK